MKRTKPLSGKSTQALAYRLSRSPDVLEGMPDRCLLLPVWWWDSSLAPSLCPTEVRIMEFSKANKERFTRPVCTLTRFVAESIGQSYFSNQLSFPLSAEIILENHSGEQKSFLMGRKRTCPCFWWCSPAPRAAQTAAGVDGWCFQAVAQLQTSGARNPHPCIHQRTAGTTQPGWTAMQKNIL